MNTLVKNYFDSQGFGWTVRIRFEDDPASVEFEVFAVVSASDTGPSYERKDFVRSGDETENLDEAATYVRGRVVCNGCSHLYFGKEGYIHRCDADFSEPARALHCAYKFVSEHMKAMEFESVPDVDLEEV